MDTGDFCWSRPSSTCGWTRGDFFPNISRGWPEEPSFQRAWFTLPKMKLLRAWKARVKDMHNGERGWWLSKRQLPPFDVSIKDALLTWLRGRPVVSVSGNHDWQNVAELLRGANHFNLAEGPITLQGHRWAGFSEVPYLEGEWNFEAQPWQLDQKVAAMKAADPDILLTHSPPGGVLDGTMSGGHVGIPQLTSWLMYGQHNVSLNLFGHVHEGGGKAIQHGDTMFVNGSNRVRLLEFDM